MKTTLKIIVGMVALCTISTPIQARSNSSKPRVWIYTDMSDRNLKGTNKEGTINDPDDISAMAAYLMLNNRFDTQGIVVTSTHRKEHATTPDQAKWAESYFTAAYKKDLKGLNKNIGGYPKSIPFLESSLIHSMERFDPTKKYEDLSKYQTVNALYKNTRRSKEPIYVLCWGALTEPAIIVKHCIENRETELLERIIFISHWSNSSLHQGSVEHPEHVANCRDDARACSFLKECASRGIIKFYECGAIGQHGVVSGSPKGEEYFAKFKNSELGKIFVAGKYVYNSVDFSDAATYIVLLGDWGVSLDDIESDGTNPASIELANEKSLKENSPRLHDHLLEISNAALLK